MNNCLIYANIHCSRMAAGWTTMTMMDCSLDCSDSCDASYWRIVNYVSDDHSDLNYYVPNCDDSNCI